MSRTASHFPLFLKVKTFKSEKVYTGEDKRNRKCDENRENNIMKYLLEDSILGLVQK